MAPKYTRSTGATSGAESYLLAWAVVLAFVPLYGFSYVLWRVLAMLAVQLALCGYPDKTMFWHAATSMKLGPKVMRNASIGFAECVRPGGKPTSDHCLNLYHLPGPVTGFMAGSAVLAMLAVGPVLAAIRVCYPEHWQGVPKSKLKLWWFFIRHPVAIQGEGPSNGDGLAAMNGAESLIYPITERELVQGPLDRDYWFEEGRPRLRDMFHDKLFCPRFFKSHGAPHPVMVCEVQGHKRRETMVPIEKAPKDLIWKPRFSTMGLGVEHFNGWDKVDNGSDWAPSTVPYVVEEYIKSTEYGASEWYRMTTLWDYKEKEPKTGYIWRTRNEKTDKRVQTDIIGGAYCISSKYTPFVGPKCLGMCVDPRKPDQSPSKLDPLVEKAITRAIELQVKMHKSLGIEFHSIGWDVMIRNDEPVFIEFNVNNGFFVADHSLEEVEQMTAFYGEQVAARVQKQLIDFDPEKEDKKREGKKKK